MQTPLTISLQTAPGPVGLMLGEKEFSPPTAFSVGETAGGDDGADEGGVEGGVDGGVVALVAGASFSVVGLQPVMTPTAIRAAPAPISRLRVNPPEVMRASRLLVGASWGPAKPEGSLWLMVTAAKLRRQGAVKPSRLCDPSQNGFFSE
jgi:hypothetical protein